MYVVVGRFRFRPMTGEERQELVRRIERDVPPIARDSPGFRGIYFVRVDDDELMTVWQWDRQADWEAASPRFGPMLQEYVVPRLAQPPERVGGKVVVQATSWRTSPTGSHRPHHAPALPGARAPGMTAAACLLRTRVGLNPGGVSFA